LNISKIELIPNSEVCRLLHFFVTPLLTCQLSSTIASLRDSASAFVYV